jgi:hypothetical protein
LNLNINIDDSMLNNKHKGYNIPVKKNRIVKNNSKSPINKDNSFENLEPNEEYEELMMRTLIFLK